MDTTYLTPHKFGLTALFDELEQQGITVKQLEKHMGFNLKGSDLDFEQRLLLFKTARALSKSSETGLLAGKRQEISYWGVYGYAMATSATLVDAFRIATHFFALSGSMLRVTLTFEGHEGVFRSHQPESLGDVLPFIAEYWRASQSRLFERVLGRRFPTTYMGFTYQRPAHAKLYRDIFQCPVEFGCEQMEWRFDASVLSAPCVRADPKTAHLCRSYCEQFVGKSSTSHYQREVLRACLSDPTTICSNASTIAHQIGTSRRTLYRKLDSEGTTFKRLVDQLKLSVAMEYLANTNISVEDIAARCGYQDVSNFRKAFRRWTQTTPTAYRPKR